LPLFDNRAKSVAPAASGQGGCAERRGDEEVSGAGTPNGGCEEGVAK
jgi:hypothetical protein